jgi:hypothetical protein
LPSGNINKGIKGKKTLMESKSLRGYKNINNRLIEYLAQTRNIENPTGLYVRKSGDYY